MSSYQEISSAIIGELSQTLGSVDSESARAFCDVLLSADEVFCAGAGRSGFQVKGFAMRLMHMGIRSYVVGETCTPNIGPDGVLVIISGSGETASLVNHARKAKELGAKLLLVTIDPESTIAQLADAVVSISAPSPKASVEASITTIQPMGSLFEQSAGLFLDYIVVMAMKRQGMSSDEMFGRHANLE
ncbi:MAG: 6-phospho-3-hexuloisomerase [Atopobiaceae bacterium]|nr:6-phospho-3-hexuloisomerase [Atopobiaceae bacterium]